MEITLNPTNIYPNSRLLVVCKVSLSGEVDTPVRVRTRWNAPTPIYVNSRINFREDQSTSHVYQSILLINPVLFSDAGFYTCIAEIGPQDSDDSFVIGVPWAAEGMNLEVCKYRGSLKVTDIEVSVAYSWVLGGITIFVCVMYKVILTSSKRCQKCDLKHNSTIAFTSCSMQKLLTRLFNMNCFSTPALNVSIRVSYTPPSDFTLPSPPYYRPASSVSLTCLAPSDAVPPLTYRWSSTCSSCSVSSSSSREITIDILRSSDSGTHTCTVTDSEGHTGQANTEMRLFGMYNP